MQVNPVHKQFRPGPVKSTTQISVYISFLILPHWSVYTGSL